MTLPPIMTLALGLFPIVSLVGGQVGTISSIMQSCTGMVSSCVGLPFSAMTALGIALSTAIIPFLTLL
jgi:glycogen synthase